MICDRCNKRLDPALTIHTCTPPAIVAELEAQLAQANRDREVAAEHYVVELRHWQQQIAQLEAQLVKVTAEREAEIVHRSKERQRAEQAEAQVAVERARAEQAELARDAARRERDQWECVVKGRSERVDELRHAIFAAHPLSIEEYEAAGMLNVADLRRIAHGQHT